MRIEWIMGIWLVCILCGSSRQSLGQPTTRVSVSTTGQQGNANSGPGDGRIAVSSDGRFVAFESLASDLSPFDTNGALDVFVRDRMSGETSRVSVSSTGSEGDFDSWAPALSADGRYVAFDSFATNLVFGDTNGSPDVFVHDRETRTTTRVNVTSSGIEATAPTGYGHPAVSADGRYVAFSCFSSALVPNDSNATWDVFVRDRQSGETSRVSIDSAGAEGDLASTTPSISADGRYVAFESLATNLVPGDTNFCTGSRGDPGHPCRDIFVRDRLLGITIRESVGSDASQADGDSDNPAMSADGRFLLFRSSAGNLSAIDGPAFDVFLRDRQVGSTSLVSVTSSGAAADYASDFPAISADGRYLVFETFAGNLCSGCSLGSGSVVLRDQSSGEIRLVSVDSNGQPGNLMSGRPSVSSDGRTIAFVSTATNLVPGDTNNATDVFVHDRFVRVVTSVRPTTGSEAGGEFVRVYGNWLPTDAQTVVRFAGSLANVVSRSPSQMTVFTPVGSGIADLTIEWPTGSLSVPGAYSYVTPALAARYGNVNVARGDRENVLLVNGVAGDDRTRELPVATAESIDVVMAAPTSRETARFCVYAWRGVPDALSLREHPQNVGTTVFPTPLDSASQPQPFQIGNNLPSARLGIATFPTAPAPSRIARVPQGVGRRTIVTLQGFIKDDGSTSSAHASVTNAVILRIGG